MYQYLKYIYNNKNFNNSFWNVLDVVIYPIFFIITTPFFIKHLGTEVFGIWLLMTTINLSLQVLNFGIGVSLIYHTAKYISIQKDKIAYKIINNSISFLLILFPFILMIAYFLKYLLRHTNWFNITDEYHSLAASIVVFAALIAYFRIFQTSLMAILNGKELYAPNTIINTASRVLILFVGVILVYMDYGLLEIFIASLAINILAVFLYYWQIKLHFKGYQFQWQTEYKYIKEIFDYGLWVWLQQLFSTITFQLDKYFVTIISGPKMLVYYSLSSIIVNHIHMAYGAMSAWLFPRISSLIENRKEYIPLFLSVRSLILFLALISIFFGGLFQKELFSLWLGKENAIMIIPIFSLFLIYEVVYIHTILPVFLMQGMQKVKLSTIYTLVYKLAIVCGMTVAFFSSKDVIILLKGIIIPLSLVLPFLHFYINKKSIQLNSLYESILIFIPSIILIAYLLTSKIEFKLTFFIIFIFSLYFIYFKRIKFDKLKTLENI